MSTAAAPGLRARPATYAGLFVLTLTTLAYEIVLTRIFSVTMWYHFAFVAISVALFGTTAGALLVHQRPQWFTEERVKGQMWRYALAYSLFIVVAISTQLSINFRVEANAGAMAAVFWTCVIIAIPFVCAGVVVCLALTKFGDKVNRLYAADLIGAGLGCLLLVLAFNYFDGPSLVILVAAVAAIGAFLFAVDAKELKGMVLAGGVTVLLLLGAFGNDALHARNKPFVKILYTKEEKDTKHRDDTWNAFSRVTVDGDPAAFGDPFGNGLSDTMPEDLQARQLSMLIDSTAGTVMTGYDGDPDQTDFLRYDISNLAYWAQEGPDFDRAAIIGVGGGRDVLSAAEFGADHIDGIEINDNILDLVTDTYGDFTNLDEIEGLELHNDEARSYITRTSDEFDTIQISLIDTWAATSAGAFALSENSLYTTDAWNTFLDKLSGDGILSVSRWFRHENPEPLEMLRTTALASQVLTDRGVENPRDHILIYEGPPEGPVGATVGTIMVSQEPFTQDQLATVGDIAEDMEFSPVLGPDFANDEFPFAPLVEPGGPGPNLDVVKADISPPTDDKPFFFQMADMGNVIRQDLPANKQVFRSVVVLASLAVAVLLLAAVCIGGPLFQIGRRTRHKGRTPQYLYFCGIGLGFLMVEISQLMRLSTFLGHPTYALTVVLFTVLIFSGIGSMLVDRITKIDRPMSLLIPLLVLLGVALVFGLVTPELIEQFADRTTPVRIAVSVGLLAPMAFFMGMPFSIGMRMASTDEDSPTAFLWGINGAMSVVASVFATVIALFFGIIWTFVAGILAYILATASMYVLVKRLRGTGAEVSTNGAEPAEEDATDDAEDDAPEALTPATN
ncbi:MAG TPA: hypothetical protein VK611_20130 [Acidimicrobiales bacterium]|nr:hypothetical protein [Acidimicrobiales bacterium]